MSVVTRNSPSRRRTLFALGALSASSLFPSGGRAQDALPDKALRILVGFSAGGGAELMARIVAPRLELRTGRRVTVENKPNTRDEPAGVYLSKGLAEGSVIAFLPTTTIATTLQREIFPFDSNSDLVPLTMAGMLQLVLAVSPSTGVTRFADYSAWLKAGPPERLRLGTTATDSYLKLYSMMLGRELGVSLQDVPSKGAAPLVAELKAGRMKSGIGSVATLLEHTRTDGVKMLMTSGTRRVGLLRDVPTAMELGLPALELREWYGFFGSSASPPGVSAEWSRQLQSILVEPEIVAQLARLGLDAAPSTQAEAVTRFAARVKEWRTRMASFGLKMVD